MSTIHVNSQACVGSGMCVFISEKYFALDDTPVVEIRQETVDEADRTAVEEAVDACPAAALALRVG
jgi:ferredoxin